MYYKSLSAHTCGSLILGFFSVKENTWGVIASHLMLILQTRAVTVVQPVRALPCDVSICYCCSAQRGQQRIADLLESKRSSALRCNTEEKCVFLIYKGEIGEAFR